jgi:hypothetical protein
MAEHQWAPPEHPDVTLRQPVSFSADLAGPLTTIDPPQPVWADIAFEQIPDTLHLKCFAIASSDVAVLVQTAWQGRLQDVLVDRDYVFRRHPDPNVR